MQGVIKDRRVVVGITIAGTENVAKMKTRQPRKGLSFKGLIRVGPADSSGEVTLLEKGMTEKRGAAGLTAFNSEDRLAQRWTEN